MQTTEPVENTESFEQLNQIDQSTLDALLGGTEGTSLIPESLVPVMIASFIALNVLAVLFFIFYLIGLIRKWKTESAVFHMQKDLAEIKAHLVTPVAATVPADEPKPVDPLLHNNSTIASSDTDRQA